MGDSVVIGDEDIAVKLRETENPAAALQELIGNEENRSHDLKKQVHHLEREKSKKKGKNSKHAENDDAQKELINSLQKDLKRSETMASIAKKALESATEQRKSLQIEYEAKLEELHQRITDLRMENKAILEDKKQEIANLQKRVQELELQVGTEDSRDSKAEIDKEKTIKELEGLLKAESEGRARMEQQQQQLIGQIASLEEKLMASKKQILETKELQRQATEKVQGRSQRQSEVVKELEGLRADLEQREHEVANLTEEVEALRNRPTGWKALFPWLSCFP